MPPRLHERGLAALVGADERGESLADCEAGRPFVGEAPVVLQRHVDLHGGPPNPWKEASSRSVDGSAVFATSTGGNATGSLAPASESPAA